jgi:tetratricopeptide (TPR) repeat protein
MPGGGRASRFSRLKFMRPYLLYAASLAAAMASGDFSLAQAPGKGHNPPPRQAGADDSPIPAPRSFSGTPGVPAPAPGAAPKSGAARPGELKQAFSPKPAPEAMRKQILEALFGRLRNAGDPGEAQRIAASIEGLWLQSDSDTANLLMQRATVSMQARQYPLALSLFDKLVALEPDWAEAWNQRATTRFLTGDTDGAMADINQVVKLEPRHFGALAGMGMILQGAGLEKSALETFKKALAIYPLEPNIQKLVEKLTLEIEGQDI